MATASSESINETTNVIPSEDESIKQSAMESNSQVPLKSNVCKTSNNGADGIDIEMKENVKIKNEIEEDNRAEIMKICDLIQENTELSPKFLSSEESVVDITSRLKRKYNPSSEKIMESSLEEGEKNPQPKRAKRINDEYCWRCHRDSADTFCSVCPRSWHRKCIIGVLQATIVADWICGECTSILKAESASTRSVVMENLTVEQLCMILRCIIGRMRLSTGSEAFWKAVDLNEVPTYLDYIIKPMDLSKLEMNTRDKMYGSTEAFMADAKWILHNCIVFNTCGGTYPDTSKLTNSARQLLKIARQEVSEVEACADCYIRSRNLTRPQLNWFIEICHPPHPLIWAKLKGFPYWPAKAMPRINNQGYVDVRFFGEHDRAWVAPKDLYLFSKEPPTALPRKRRCEMIECLREISQHCQKLEESFGSFEFAPPKTAYNPHDPMQIKKLLPQYDSAVSSEGINSHQNGDSMPPKKLVKSPIQLNVDTESDFGLSSPEKTEDPLALTFDIAESVKQKKRHKPLSTNSEIPDISTSDESPNEKNSVALKKVAKPRKTKNKEAVENSFEKAKSTPKRRYSISKQENSSVSKAGTSKIYKPKSRLVDKLIAETHVNDSSQQLSNDSCNTDTSNLFPSIQVSEPEKKTGRAKKSFPNKPRQFPTRSQANLKNEVIPEKSIPMVYIPNQRLVELNNYDLPPPEAGPMSSQLNKCANKLVKQIAQLMEETIKESAESGINNLGNSVDTHQATIYSLRLQIERMRWLHEQQIAELKHNTERTLREMKVSFEAERIRAIEENNRQHQEELNSCVEKTKSKQWCISCGHEAIYNCCWNASYCTTSCQQSHWKTHKPSCTRKPITRSTENSPDKNKNNDEKNDQNKDLPRLTNAQHDSNNV